MDESKTTIAPEVLTTIARLTALGVEGVSRMWVDPARVGRIFHRGFSEGIRMEIVDGAVFADLYLALKCNVNVREVSRNVQHQVSRAISEMVGMPVGRVNIHIEDIDYPGDVEA